MRVCLVYTADAGNGIAADDLRRDLEEVGHDVIHLIDEEIDPARMAGDSIELVVAAGGDGTIGRAASALAGHSIPLAILPLGTANNIAKSLGIRGSPCQLIRNWRDTRRLPLDVGVVRGKWGERRFVEGVGSGLISRGIVAPDAKSTPSETGTSAKLIRAIRSYRKILATLTPQPMTVIVDGDRIDTALLLVEVLNTRSVGPNLVLSADANPSDGYLEVVTARESDRKDLDEYLRRREEGKEARLSLATRRAQRVDIEGLEETHMDDQVCRGPSVAALSIRVDAGAVELVI